MFEITRDRTLDEDQFVDILRRSTLADRRPVDQPACIRRMLEQADLLITAWADELLIGVARSVTDFGYCCYLSDLAVDLAYQRRGVGRQLIDATRQALDPGCTLILLSAPAATDYYPRLGFTRHPSAWTLPARDA